MIHKLKEFEKGVILINKPAGITSFRVVARVRRYLLDRDIRTTGRECHCERSEAIPVGGEMRLLRDFVPRNDRRETRRLKVGHTGTLDSMASGLLIILVGEATKRQGEFTRLPKEYEGEFALGVESDTYSADGRLRFYSEQEARPTVSLKDTPSPGGRGKGEGKPPSSFLPSLRDREISLERLVSVKRAEVEILFKRFHGEQEQTVPPFSAVQVKGERLHRLARRGHPLPELPKRKIKIDHLELLDFRPLGVLQPEKPTPEEFLNVAPRIRFRAGVSSGTYVRALVVDIGRALGTGAVLTQLTRTKIGPYRLSDAIDLPSLSF